MTDREDIAAAATGPGVTIEARYTQGTKPGTGFVRYSADSRPSDNGWGWMVGYDVFVWLPQDLRKAEEWLDEHMVPMVERLNRRDLRVEGFGPQTVVLENGAGAYALVINGVRGT